jgi:hypothetical protein
MTDLLTELKAIGLEQLTFDDQQRIELDQFITVCSPFFNSICQQKPDSPRHDLLLGVMTKAQNEAQLDFEQKRQSLHNMQQVFKKTVGKEHADKLVPTDSNQLIVITTLWLLVQGYQGIDFSYANDHATEVANLLSGDKESDSSTHTDTLRSGFMQAYYISVDNAQANKPTTSMMDKMKQWLQRSFF